MTRARAPAVIVQMPQTCGSLACVERATDYTRNYYRSAEDQRKQRQQRERRRRARARRKFAFTLALLIVAGLLAAFMPWSGTAPELPTDVPPDTEEANLAAGLTAGQAFVAIPKQDKPAYIPDAAEVEALAKMLYGEARGVVSDTEKAACVWCVLNRVDDPRFPDTVLEVVAAPYQFAGYSADYPVLPELERIAADVLTRYHEEKSGGENVGRVLPAEYCFFTGDGERNYFTAEWQGAETWGWTLSSPYDD